MSSLTFCMDRHFTVANDMWLDSSKVYQIDDSTILFCVELTNLMPIYVLQTGKRLFGNKVVHEFSIQGKPFQVNGRETLNLEFYLLDRGTDYYTFHISAMTGVHKYDLGCFTININGVVIIDGSIIDYSELNRLHMKAKMFARVLNGLY